MCLFLLLLIDSWTFKIMRFSQLTDSIIIIKFLLNSWQSCLCGSSLLCHGHTACLDITIFAPSFLCFFFSFIFINWTLITLQYCSGFCHTLTWISHGFTCVPHPDPPSYLPPNPFLFVWDNLFHLIIFNLSLLYMQN